MKKIILSFLTIACSICSFINAQTISQTTPQEVNTCDTTIFFVVVSSPTTLNNANLYIELEPDINLTSLAPFTSLGNGIYDFPIATIVANTPDTLFYSVYLPCSMMDLTNAIGGNSGSYIQIDSLWLADSIGDILVSNSSSYNITNPNLFTTPNDPKLDIKGYIGQSILRDVAFFNSQDTFNGTFTYETVLNCDSVVLDSLVLMQNDTILQTFIDTNYFEFTNANLSGIYVSDSMHIKEYYSVVGCIASCNNDGYARSAIEINWGCNSDSLCHQITLQGTIQRDNSEPDVNIYRIAPELETIDYSNWCIQSPSTLQNLDLNQHFEKRKFVLVNDGNFPALDFTFRLAGNYPNMETYLFEENYWVLTSNGDTILPFNIQYLNNNDNSNCLDSIVYHNLQPLSYLEFNLPVLEVLDTIFLEYYLFNCCPENDANYFTKDLYFNKWSIKTNTDYSQYYDECRIKYGISNGIVDTLQTNLYNGEMNAPLELSLDQFINFSAVSHLNGDSNCSGETTTIGVVNSNFNGSSYPYNQSEPFFFDNLGNSLNGQFRIDIETDFGLSINSNQFSLITLTDGITTYTPDSVIPIQNYNSSMQQGTIISAYFPLNVFTDYSEMDDFLSSSIFNFQVQACCPGLPQPAVKIDWRINLNPDNCSDCWIPLSSQEDILNVLCPGCITPGIMVKNSIAKRRNYGYLDSDDNGLADDPLVSFDPNAPYADPLASYIGMFGDTFDIHASAECYAGTDNNNDGGVSFNSLTNYWGSFESLYIDIQSPNCGEATIFNFTAVEASLKVKLNGSSVWSTPIDILPLLQTSNYPLFFEVGASFLENADTSYFPSNFSFHPDNEYEVDIAFTICGNDVTLPELKDCSVNTIMWWGNDSMGENATLQIEHAGDRNEAFAGTNNSNGTTLQERIENLNPDSALFYCESNGSTIRLFRYTRYNSIEWGNSKGSSGVSCTKKLISNIRIRLGSSNNANMFPKEYRPINFTFKGIEFTPPSTYVLIDQSVKTRIRFGGLTKIASDTSLLFNYSNNLLFEIDSNEYQFAIEAFPLNSTSTNINPSFLPLGDEQFWQTTEFYFLPDSACSRDTVIMNDNEPSLYLNASNCGSIGIDTLQSSASTTTKLYLPFPPLEYSNGANNVYTVNQDTFCAIEFSITNPNKWPDNSNNNLTAYNPFVYAEHPDLSILSLERFVNNNWQSVPQNSGGIFELPSLANNKTYDLRICISYDRCTGDTLIQLPIRYGYQCGGYLQDPINTACFDSTGYVSLYRVAASLNEGPFTQDSTFSLCDTIAMSACTYATSPGEIDQLYTILTLPIGASITDVLVSFPGTNNPSVPINPNLGQFIPPSSWMFNVPNSSWELTTGTGDTLCYSFAFEYIPSCQIGQSGPPQVLVGGVAYCGDTIAPQILNFVALELVGNNCTPLVVDSVINTIDAVCGTGGEIYLNVTGQTPFTFDWQPINQLTVVPNIDSLAPGFYDVTVTDGNGCDTLIQGIEVRDSSISNDPITLAYDSCLGSITLTAPSGSSYLWNTTDTTQSITVYQTGYYDVDVMQNGCLGTFSTTINNLPTPASVNISIVIGTNQSSQTLLSDAILQYPQLSGSMIGLNLLINGELLMDLNSYDIKNSNLYFSPGSGITFEDTLLQNLNGSFNIINSNFDALGNCSTMWRGISLGHQIKLSIDQSSVNNAMYGIQVKHKSYLKATNTIFTNNFIGIFLPPFLYNINNNSGLVGFFVDDCTFKGEAPGLLNPYPGQTSYLTNLLETQALPAQGKKPFAGVLGINAHSFGLGNCHFEYLAFGVRNINTLGSFNELKVDASTFDYITNTNINGMSNYNNNTKQGTGIYSETDISGTLGQIYCTSNIFNNGYNGIKILQSNAYIRSNTLTTIKFGVKHAGSPNCISNITNNTFVDNKTSIILTNNKPLKELLVYNNTINMTNTNIAYAAARGIEVKESDSGYLPPQEIGVISYNTITMQRGNSAMFFSNTDSLFVDTNNINMGNGFSPLLKFGIKVEGSKKMIFADNHINKPGVISYSSGSSIPKGFDLSDCLDCLLECNTTNNTHIGVHIKNIMDNFNIKGHIFGNHSTGLKYSNTLPGVQNHNGNQWTGTYANIIAGTGGGAAYNGNFNGGSTFGQEFFISNPPNSSYFPDSSQIYPSINFAPFTVNWFFSGNSQADFDCTTDALYKSTTPSSIIMDELVAKGKYPLPSYKEPLNLNGQRNLYEKIEKEKIELGESSPIDSFYFANQSTAVKTLYEAQALVKSKKESASSEKQQLELIKNQLLAIMDSIQILDSLYQEDTLINPIYIQLKEDLQEEVENLSFIGVNLNQQIINAELIINNAALQKYLDANIVYTLDYNTKYTSQVYLESIAKNIDIASSKLGELQIIAEQCPSAGGKGVYIARNLLQSYYEDSIMIWEDDYRCLLAGYNLYKQPDEENSSEEYEEESILPSKISIYPNPNDGSFLIQLANTDKVEIQILDLLGKSVFETMSKNNLSIPLQLKLSKGVYILNIKQNKHLIHQEKIIIQ